MLTVLIPISPQSRHGGPGVEAELFGSIQQLQAISDSTEGQVRRGCRRSAALSRPPLLLADPPWLLAAGCACGLRWLTPQPPTSEQVSMVDLAIGRLLAQPGVSCLLVGASTPAQATRNALIPVKMMMLVLLLLVLLAARADVFQKAVPEGLLRRCTEETEALRLKLGPEIDSYG